MQSMQPVAADAGFQAIVTMFVEELGDRAEALQQSIDSNDAQKIRTLAHQLKGSSGGYGFPELGALAGQVERRCLEGADEADRNAAAETLLAACLQIAESRK